MNLKEFVSKITFKTITPKTKIEFVKNVTANVPDSFKITDEVDETCLPEDSEIITKDLLPLLDIKRMSTFAVAAMLWKAVREMADDQIFLNIGLFHGFSFFAGSKGTDTKTCVGVDSYVLWAEAKDHFMAYMNRESHPSMHFFGEDFRTFFRLHMPQFKKEIGVYFCDADHSEKGTLEALEIAKPFMSKDCVVFLDDTNLSGIRKVADKFFKKKEWDRIFESRTCRNQHPTFWNGITIFKRRK